MEFTNLLNDLNLPDEVIQALENRRDLFCVHHDLIVAMTQRETAASACQALLKTMGEDDMGLLACHLYAAAMTREKYRLAGMDDNIFLDTMGCFRRFLCEAERRTGKMWFDRGWWTWRQLSMRIFRIGELEYELYDDPHAVAMHIPSDSDISAENVERSIGQAKAFVPRYFPDYGEAPFGCESWLLSPSLRDFLEDGSRIRAFQDRFFLIHVDPQPKDEWEWLFASPEDTPVEELPERTSLQRKVKKHLLSGGSIGVARGILK